MASLTLQAQAKLHESLPSRLPLSLPSHLSHRGRSPLIQTISGVLPPVYLYITKLFIDFVGDPQATMAEGAALFSVFAALLIIQIIFRHLFFFYLAMFAVVVRKAMTGILYQKLMRLSQSSVAKASPGKLINLASGDMAVIERGFQNLPYIVTAPISTIVTVVLLYFIVSQV